MTNNAHIKDDDAAHLEFLSGLPFFTSFNPDQLAQLAPLLSVQRYQSGESIFSQNDQPQAVYLVVSGRVDYIVSKNDVHHIADTYSTGEVFGDTAFFGIQTQVASAIVTGAKPAEFLVLDRHCLMTIADNNQALFTLLLMNVMRDLSRRYQKKLTL